MDTVSLRPGLKTYLFIDWGGIIWDRGGNFSKFIDRGSHRGASHRRTCTGCSDGKENERETNRKSYPAIDDEV